MYNVPRMLFILRHYINDLLHAVRGGACSYIHFSNCMRTVNVNVIMHLLASYKLTYIDKFMYMQAYPASSIFKCMHALHVITLKHCHIVAMGITLLQLSNSLSSTQLTLEVLSIKHWRQIAFAETPLMARHSREARLWRARSFIALLLKTEVRILSP